MGRPIVIIVIHGLGVGVGKVLSAALAIVLDQVGHAAIVSRTSAVP